MSIKSRIIKVRERGTEKSFLLTEMPAYKAEKWACRALQAMGRESRGGIVELDRLLRSMVDQPVNLLDVTNELLTTCVRFIPNPEKPDVSVALIDNDGDGSHIDDYQTRTNLKWGVLDLHCGFIYARKPLELDSGGFELDGGDDLDVELAEYPNVPSPVAVVLSAWGPSALVYLDESMGVEDLYDLLEVMRVDAHNKRLVRAALEARRRGD